MARDALLERPFIQRILTHPGAIEDGWLAPCLTSGDPRERRIFLRFFGVVGRASFDHRDPGDRPRLLKAIGASPDLLPAMLKLDMHAMRPILEIADGRVMAGVLESKVLLPLPLALMLWEAILLVVHLACLTSITLNVRHYGPIGADEVGPPSFASPCRCRTMRSSQAWSMGKVACSAP